MKSVLGVAAFLACLIVSGCGTPVVVRNPIANTGSARIAVMPAACMAMGTAGGHYDGLFHDLQYYWVLGQNLPPVTVTTVFTEAARNGFVMNGYDAIAAASTVITPDMASDLDFAVMATVTTFNIDTYGFWSYDETKCVMNVSFEVTDLHTGQMVFQRQYEARGTTDGVNMAGAITTASLDAVNGLLSEQPLHDILCNPAYSGGGSSGGGAGGTAGSGWLGIEISSELQGVMAQAFDAPEGSVMVMSIEPGSPAETAGIQARDVIVAIDGQQVTSTSWAVGYLASISPGEGIAFEIIRDGQTMNVVAIMGQHPVEQTVNL
jgi:hypothetical protein